MPYLEMMTKAEWESVSVFQGEGLTCERRQRVKRIRLHKGNKIVKILHSVGLEPTSTNTLELESSPLDRSGTNAVTIIAHRGFDPRTFGLWAQHASSAPVSNCCQCEQILAFINLAYCWFVWRSISCPSIWSLSRSTTKKPNFLPRDPYQRWIHHNSTPKCERASITITTWPELWMWGWGCKRKCVSGSTSINVTHAYL